MHTYVSCMHTYIHTCIHTRIHADMHPYITLDYITLHYITIHYITLHYITLHYMHPYTRTCINVYIYTYTYKCYIHLYCTSSGKNVYEHEHPLSVHLEKKTCSNLDQALLCLAHETFFPNRKWTSNDSEGHASPVTHSIDTTHNTAWRCG